MSDFFFIFILVLLAVAIILREDFIFIILYLLVGAYFFSRWWGRRSLSAISVCRKFSQRAFLGERIPVRLEIKNESLLPLAWLQVRESLPVRLRPGGSFRQVTSLGPKEGTELSYVLECSRRGYYPVGPLVLDSGDVLGMAGIQRRQEEAEFITVYPKIIPLTKVQLPSYAPLGTLRHHQPVFEDPSRVMGKRDYVAGDSLRRIDWKSSASSGRLQVKLFEPSIALETAIFLNLNTLEYRHLAVYSASELAIVVAASLANWVVAARQAVGLVTNGVDPLLDNQSPTPMPPHRGRGHLLRILEILARIQVGETFPLAQLVNQQASSLPWGTTLILITNQIDDTIFDGLFQARRSGLNAFLIQCGPSDNYAEIRRRAKFFGFPIHQVLSEQDLDVWRR